MKLHDAFKNNAKGDKFEKTYLKEKYQEEINNQPERSKREDVNYFGMKAEIRSDGLCYLEDGRIIDPSQYIGDAVL